MANDGDFDVVRLDAMMTKKYLVLFFFEIQLLIPPLLLIFYIIYNYAEFVGYASLEIIYGPKSQWTDFDMGRFC